MPELQKSKVNDSITIKPMSNDDVATIEIIRRECGFAAITTNLNEIRLFDLNSINLAARKQEKIVGFVSMRLITSVVEIDEIGVLPGFRRSRIGQALLCAAIDFASENKAAEIWLEVRDSNIGALQFYLRNNFEIVGRRPRYYNLPVEDAILLSLEISDLSEKMNAKLDDQI